MKNVDLPATHQAPAQSVPCQPPSPRRTVVVAVILFAAIGAALYEGVQTSRQKARVQVLTAQLLDTRKELDSALKQLADSSAKPRPRLPAPAVQFSPQASPPENLQSTSLYARFHEKDGPKLTGEQVEAYLKAYGRNASSLLAGFRTSGDPALLKEAMEKYPDDPGVAFEAAFAKDLTPEQKREWLNAFERSAPDNPLANYLSARDYLKAGQTDQAIQELLAASGKRQFQDYTLARRQDDEEAYLAAGYSTAEAKMIASGQVELPQLAELKQLGIDIVELSKSYRQAGDNASAQAVLEMAVSLGQSYSAADCAISHLVGMAIQRIALNAMPPDAAYGSSGQTARQYLDQLNQQKTDIATFFNDNRSLMARMSDQDWISYIDRDKSFGEEAALRWLVSKYGQK